PSSISARRFRAFSRARSVLMVGNRPMVNTRWSPVSRLRYSRTKARNPGDADAEADDAGAGHAGSVGVAVYLRALRRRLQVANDGVGEEDHASSVSSPYRQ